MFWYTTLKITLSCSSNSNCRRFLRLQRLLNFLSRSGSRSETLKFECRLQADSCPHTRSPSWWSQQVATSRPSPNKKCFSYFFGWFLAECTFTTMGPPLSPSQLSCPPDVVPAHTKIFGIHSFWPEFLDIHISLMFSSMWTFVYYLYILMHLLFDMIGNWTSRRTGDICPYSDNLPHPVTVPTWKEV